MSRRHLAASLVLCMAAGAAPLLEAGCAAEGPITPVARDLRVALKVTGPNFEEDKESRCRAFMTQRMGAVIDGASPLKVRLYLGQPNRLTVEMDDRVAFTEELPGWTMAELCEEALARAATARASSVPARPPAAPPNQQAPAPPRVSVLLHYVAPGHACPEAGACSPEGACPAGCSCPLPCALDFGAVPLGQAATAALDLRFTPPIATVLNQDGSIRSPSALVTGPFQVIRVIPLPESAPGRTVLRVVLVFTPETREPVRGRFNLEYLPLERDARADTIAVTLNGEGGDSATGTQATSYQGGPGQALHVDLDDPAYGGRYSIVHGWLRDAQPGDQGAPITLESGVYLGAGRAPATTRITIGRRALHANPYLPQDWTGDRPQYQVFQGSRYDPGPGTNLCPPPSTGWALALPGYWHGGRYYPAPHHVSFACIPSAGAERSAAVQLGAGAVARCIDWGYKPWGSDPVASGARHAACVLMAMADYAGGGVPGTVDGTVIELGASRRDVGLPPFGLEAAWTTTLGEPEPIHYEGGALCLSRRRWSTLPYNPPGLAPLDPRLLGGSGRFCEAMTGAAQLYSRSPFADAGLYLCGMPEAGQAWRATTDIDLDGFDVNKNPGYPARNPMVAVYRTGPGHPSPLHCPVFAGNVLRTEVVNEHCELLPAAIPLGQLGALCRDRQTGNDAIRGRDEAPGQNSAPAVCGVKLPTCDARSEQIEGYVLLPGAASAAAELLGDPLYAYTSDPVSAAGGRAAATMVATPRAVTDAAALGLPQARWKQGSLQGYLVKMR